MKLYIQLGIIFALIAGITIAVNTLTIVKKSTVSNLQDSNAKKDKKILKLDSTVFSIQQTVDMKTQTDNEFQIVIRDLKAENKKLKSNENSCCAELKHLEETGNIRYFIKKCLSGKYEEVFEKPKGVSIINPISQVKEIGLAYVKVDSLGNIISSLYSISH